MLEKKNTLQGSLDRTRNQTSDSSLAWKTGITSLISNSAYIIMYLWYTDFCVDVVGPVPGKVAADHKQARFF